MSATIREVARAAGVSTATVSRALNGAAVVAEATRLRIEAAVQDLGYRPNTIARNLALRQSHSIGLLLPDIANPFFPDLVKGVQLAADARHYTLLLCNTDADPAKEEGYLETLRAKQVDGLLLVGLTLRRERLLRAVAGGVPVVSLDRDVDLPGATLVQVDHRAGARAATEHLLALGHRAVAHVTGPVGLRVSRERIAGYRQALAERGLPYDPALVAPGDFSEEGGYRGAEALLEAKKPFTALFAANDLSAIGALAALKDRAIEVPAGVSVVGFDGIRLSAYTWPPLTTIRQPTFEMGGRATELLIEAIRSRGTARPGTVTFRGELVVRQSSRPPAGAAGEAAEA